MQSEIEISMQGGFVARVNETKADQSDHLVVDPSATKSNGDQIEEWRAENKPGGQNYKGLFLVLLAILQLRSTRGSCLRTYGAKFSKLSRASVTEGDFHTLRNRPVRVWAHSQRAPLGMCFSVGNVVG